MDHETWIISLLLAVSLLGLPIGAPSIVLRAGARPALFFFNSFPECTPAVTARQPWCSCKRKTHLWCRWPWHPETAGRPLFLYFLIFGLPPRPLFNPSNFSGNFVTKLTALNFCIWNVETGLIRFSWPIPAWYCVKCPLKIQLEEASLSIHESNIDFLDTAFQIHTLAKLHRLRIWQFVSLK